MGQLVLDAVPRTPYEIDRFGNGNTSRAKAYLIALYGFLASKPETTAKAYRFAIRQFFELFDWISPENVTVAEAAYYKKWLKNDGKSDSTICQRLAACQSYFDFLLEPTNAGKASALIASNPFRLVSRKDCTPTPYGRSTPTNWLDFKKLMDSIPDDIAGRRDRALLFFFANTGRRCSEVVNMKVKDLSLTSEPKTYRVRAKGGEIQPYTLGDLCHNAILDHWISANRLPTLTAESAVFAPVAQAGGSYHNMDKHRCLTVYQVTKILKRNAVRAGLDPRKFKVHGLRHMFAQDRDRGGARLQDIQRDLGHKGPGTTAIYVGKLQGPPPSAEKELAAIRAKAERVAEEAMRG